MARTTGRPKCLNNGRINLTWKSSGTSEIEARERQFRTGLTRATGRFVMIQDADLEYNPADYTVVLEPLLRGDAQVVYGSRYMGQRWNCRQNLRLFRHGVSLLNLAVRILYGQRLTDEATCYKAMPTDLLRSLDLQCERFEFCPEVTAKLCRLGIKIHEVPISYRPRGHAAGKKLRWRDGIEALRVLWRYRNWQSHRTAGG
ncbi:MAG: glycosyltransferase family 2 protein [Pirellulaceae bacterium]